MNDFLKNDIEVINQALQDDISKRIFASRLLYSMTRDYSYIREIVLDTKISKTVYGLLKKGQEETGLVLDGAGIYGGYIYSDYPQLEWLCVSDNSKAGKLFYDSLKIISRKEAVGTYPDAYYVVTSIKYFADIEKELLGLGIPKEKIINIGMMANETEKNMYFDVPFITPKKENCLVDCGAYHGENTLNYFQWRGDKRAKSYAIEADSIKFDICKKELGKSENAIVLQAAAFSRKGKIALKSSGDSQSTICDQGKEYADAIMIDEIARDNRITMIKMDIEGSELEALKGATNTIRIQKPELVVSIYHKE